MSSCVSSGLMREGLALGPAPPPPFLIFAFGLFVYKGDYCSQIMGGAKPPLLNSWRLALFRFVVEPLSHITTIQKS